MQHDGKIPETTFLRILPDRVDAFLGYMKEVVSSGLLTGAPFNVITNFSGTTGVCSVAHIDRVRLGQKVTVKDSGSSATFYVIAINVNAGVSDAGLAPFTGTVTLSATRGGAAASLAAFSTANAAALYHPGSDTSFFTSLRNALLSSANGGTATIHGQTKTAYPVLQAVNVSGASVTATNILDKILDGYTEVRRRGKGNADTILVSYKHLGSILKLIEVNKGPFKVSVNSTKASLYGWTEIEINSVRGTLKLVGVQEMDDDVIFYVDWKGLKFFSNGFFKKRMSPDGIEYFEVRNTTGYQYIVDICLFGDLQVHAPGHMGVMYSIPNY